MRARAKKTFAAMAVLAFASVLMAGIACFAWADEADEEENTAAANTSAAPEAGANAQNQTAKTNPMGDATAIDLGSGNNINPQQLPDSSFIYDTTIADLAGADAYLEGQSVQVVGEVVGDCINAELDPGYCWVVLADDADRTVSVYMSKRDAEKIDLFGRYGQVGTQLQVRGEFHLACADHEGQADIHAAHVGVVKKGTLQNDEFRLEGFIPGAVVVAIGLAMMGALNFMRERRR